MCFGIGLNVNQLVFHSDAPNPVSLAQILGHEVDRDEVLKKILDGFEKYYELLRRADYMDVSGIYHCLCIAERASILIGMQMVNLKAPWLKLRMMAI